MRELHWNYTITLPATGVAADASDTVSLIVYLDKQANGASILVDTLLESNDYQSFNKISNKDRFTVLMRKTYDIAAPGARDTLFGGAIISDSWHKTRMSLPIEFSGTFGTLAEIKSANIGVIAISRNTLAALDSTFRVRFTDS